MTDRQEFGAVERRDEVARGTLEARARAEVEAQYVMAIQRPRDMMRARARLLDAAARPRWADSAIYRLPRWDAKKRQEVEISGLNIRAAEEVARAIGNLSITQSVIHEDDERRICRARVVDLESALAWEADYVIPRRVERRRLRRGQVAISQRTGSEGQTVYLVAATDQEIHEATNRAGSKAIRNCILRCVPADILEEIRERIDETLAGQHRADPASARKRLVDRFGEIGVSADQLARYLGHALDEMSDAEYVELRQYGSAIVEGETTWDDVVAHREAERSAPREEDRLPIITRLAKVRIDRPDDLRRAAIACGHAEDVRLESLSSAQLEELEAALIPFGEDTP